MKQQKQQQLAGAWKRMCCSFSLFFSSRCNEDAGNCLSTLVLNTYIIYNIHNGLVICYNNNNSDCFACCRRQRRCSIYPSSPNYIGYIFRMALRLSAPILWTASVFAPYFLFSSRIATNDGELFFPRNELRPYFPLFQIININVWA